MAIKQGILFISAITIIVLSSALVGIVNNYSPSKITTTGDITTPAPTRLNSETATAEDGSDGAVNRTTVDLDALFTYLDLLYEPDAGTVQSRIDGFSTTVAVYQFLSILKLSSMEKYMIPSESIEERINSANFVSLKVASKGFRITSGVKEPSVAGTFGAILSLQLMNEQDKLDEIILNGTIIPWLENERFTNDTSQVGGGYHELGDAVTFETTLMALMIYEALSETISSQIKDNVTSWLVSNWKEDHFDDPNREDSLIVENWFAVKSLSIMNKSGDITPAELMGYGENILNWLNGLVVDTGIDEGSFAAGNTGTVTETATALATMSVLGNINQTEADLNQTTRFFIESQFLNETAGSDYGGFSQNNLTHDSASGRYQVSLASTYYGIMGLYLTGHLLNISDVEVTIETGYSREAGNTDAKNEILQGVTTDLFVIMAYEKYKTLTGIDVTFSGTSWNIVRDLTELVVLNGETRFYEYKFRLHNDSWVLGTHELSGSYSLKNFTLLPAEAQTFRVNLTVRLGLESILNKTGNVVPGEGLNLKIRAYNGSETHNNFMNFTEGTLNLTWFMPNSTQKLITSQNIVFPQNFTDFNITIPKNAELGWWRIQVVHYNSSQSIIYSNTNVTIDVRTEIYLTAISGVLSANPSENYQINVTFAYANGTFPAHVNATCFFENNATKTILFNTTVEPVATSSGKFSLNSTDYIPKKLYFGYYNLSIRMSWNLTTGEYYTITVRNATLSMLHVTGTVVLTDSTTFPENVSPGQLISFKTNVSILSPQNDTFVLEENLALKGYVTNTTDFVNQIIAPTVLQNGTGYNCTFNLNPNLIAGNYTFSLKVLIETNNSYVPILKIEDKKAANFNFTLSGTLQLDEIEFITPTVKSANYYHINLTEELTTVIVNFKVVTGSPEFFAAGLALHANLTSEGSRERLPAIAAAADDDIYQLLIPLSNKEPGTYSVEIYTVSALAENTLVGKFDLQLEEFIEQRPVPIEFFVAYLFGGIAILATAFNIFVRNRR